MFEHYSGTVLLNLFLMVFSGAMRTIANKVYFQLGYDDPLLALIIILIAHGFALPIYWIAKKLSSLTISDDDEEEEEEEDGSPGASIERNSKSIKTVNTMSIDDDLEVPATTTRHGGHACRRKTLRRETGLRNVSTRMGLKIHQASVRITATRWVPELLGEEEEEAFLHAIQEEQDELAPEESANKKNKRKHMYKRGSTTGLTEESEKAVQWVHRLPKWSYPMITSLFNMFDILFRITAILYLPASIASMMFCGLELVAGIVAGKYVRKRIILRERWFGAGVLVLGLVFVGSSDFVGAPSKEEESVENFGLGMLFVFLKVIMGVIKSLAQELFMQEAAVPAALLLGLEGWYGVIMAVPLYFAAGPALGYAPVESFQKAFGSVEGVGFTIGFMAIILFAGMYSLLATASTSAMTRNMWKNFRGLMVWIVAMIIYYASGNENLGEPWVIPGSLLILSGFGVMVLGLYVYYGAISCLKEPTTQPETQPETTGIADITENI